MAEDATQCAGAPVSCGVEAVWYVEQRLVGSSASRETLNRTLPKSEDGAHNLLQLRQYLEGSRGLWTAGMA